MAVVLPAPVGSDGTGKIVSVTTSVLLMVRVIVSVFVLVRTSVVFQRKKEGRNEELERERGREKERRGEREWDINEQELVKDEEERMQRGTVSLTSARHCQEFLRSVWVRRILCLV